MNEAQAKERINELKGFYGHLASFVSVNLFLFAINMATSPDSIWFVYPLFGWGIGMLMHAIDVFWTGADWEQRKLEELTGLRNTQDELQKLSERTDILVTILSSVNWDKIDPELMETKQNLEKAKDKIVQLQDNNDQDSQQKVTREIEKLEEFVTSSKFGYYELAANDQKKS